MKELFQRPIPDWLTVGLVLITLFPFVGGILSGYSEIFIGEKRSKARLKRNLVVFGSLLSIVGALLGAVLQGRDDLRTLGLLNWRKGLLLCALYIQNK